MIDTASNNHDRNPETTTEELLPVNFLCRKHLRKRNSPATNYRWVHRGKRGRKLRAYRIGGCLRCTESEFLSFLHHQAVSDGPAKGDASVTANASDEALRAAGLL
jgi:hypothetical protein